MCQLHSKYFIATICHFLLHHLKRSRNTPLCMRVCLAHSNIYLATSFYVRSEKGLHQCPQITNRKLLCALRYDVAARRSKNVWGLEMTRFILVGTGTGNSPHIWKLPCRYYNKENINDGQDGNNLDVIWKFRFSLFFSLFGLLTYFY